MERYLLLIIPIGLFSLFIWAFRNIDKQVKKDWETLEYLEEKCKTVSTKEEIASFHKEFVEKASKIHNRVIYPRLQRIDGYLRGLYKQYEKK